MKVLSSALHTVEAYSLVKENDSVLLAVSGGPDSVAMLYLFAYLSSKMQIKIGVAYYDHAQRPDSAQDGEFVRDLAKKFDWLFFTDRLQESFSTNMRQGIEALLRERRYGFLFHIAEGNGFSKISLGHNLDDQVETFFFRLIRGSGLQGIKGMGPVSVRGRFTIIRPLLFSKKTEILDFLLRNNIQYREDVSNKDLSFDRNKIRLELLPLIENSYNNRIKEHISTLSSVLSVDYDFIESHAKEVFANICLHLDDYRIAFAYARFCKLHLSMQRMLFRLAYVYLKGDHVGLEFRHWNEFVSLLEEWPNGGRLDLPNKISVLKKQRIIEFFIRN